MAWNGEEAVRVNRRLPVLRGDNDGGRIQKTLVLESSDHLPDRRIHELDFGQHLGSGGTLGILITAGVCVGADSGFGLNQLLTNADRLEVHAEDRRDRSPTCAEVRLAVDLVDYGVDLQLVVAFDG